MTRREKAALVAALRVGALVAVLIAVGGLGDVLAWTLAVAAALALGVIGCRDDFLD